ncbi:hypothetical protein G9A89_022408 [Geosiphon pyriformis]|nr:hypothetical protein G9A89_022408 [Geosiphon pyriformis]
MENITEYSKSELKILSINQLKISNSMKPDSSLIQNDDLEFLTKFLDFFLQIMKFQTTEDTTNDTITIQRLKSFIINHNKNLDLVIESLKTNHKSNPQFGSLLAYLYDLGLSPKIKLLPLNLDSTYHSIESYKLYKKSAKHNDSFALLRLSIYYRYGFPENTENLREALNCLVKSARTNNHGAAQILGNWYTWGELPDLGIDINPKKAIYWYEQPSKAGDENSQYLLGNTYIYFGTLGFLHQLSPSNLKNLRDYERKGYYWLEKAATKSQVEAQFSLAGCLAIGQGCQKDIHLSIKWYSRAKLNGHKNIQAYLSKLFKTHYCKW